MSKSDLTQAQQDQLDAKVLQRLLAHLDDNKQVQNIDLMILADFCRNCLGKWYKSAADELELDVTDEQARERIYGMTYAEWKALFEQTWMRVFSVMAVLSLAAHAWIGIWAVLTDYLTERMMGAKGNVLRFVCQILSSLAIFVYVIWTIQILWS